MYHAIFVTFFPVSFFTSSELKYVKVGKVGKVCIRAKWPIRPALISGSRSMKRLGILLLPWMGC